MFIFIKIFCNFIFIYLKVNKPIISADIEEERNWRPQLLSGEINTSSEITIGIPSIKINKDTELENKNTNEIALNAYLYIHLINFERIA